MRMRLSLWGLAALLCGLCFGGARCFPNGSVAVSCEDMLPVHEPFNLSSTTPPYSLSASAATYRPGRRITVTLEVNDSGSGYFEGFLLQARSSSRPDLWPVGKFKDLDSSQVTVLKCNNKSSSAVSQANSAKRKKVQLIWEAPDDGEYGDVHFRATVVKSYSTFWLNVTSSFMRLDTSSRAPSAVASWAVLLFTLAVTVLS